MYMNEKTIYTAVGHFKTQRDSEGRKYPVVLINRLEYRLDIQEMTVWTILNWRPIDLDQISERYSALSHQMNFKELRTLENCISRLETRGLIAAGRGDTEYGALYDLLANLYVVPISESLLLRFAVFAKLVLRGEMSVAKAKQLFRRGPQNQVERRLLSLAEQAMLSTAELIKCIELGVTDLSTADKLIEALYNDEYTTDQKHRGADEWFRV